jgi:glucose/arabinose dehydrogenase
MKNMKNNSTRVQGSVDISFLGLVRAVGAASCGDFAPRFRDAHRGETPLLQPFFCILFCACCLFCSAKAQAKQAKPLDAYLKVGSTYVGINTIATGLHEPWDITWGPDNWIWMTEHGGVVSKINPKTGKKIVLLRLPHVCVGTTPGLLGLAVEPDQKKFPYAFLTYNSKNNKGQIVLNVVRYRVHNNTLIDPKTLLTTPSAEGHVGSRIKLSPEGKLLITDGDAENGKNAQNLHSLNGKILRLNIDGSIPKDNPIPGSPIWAWGFRSEEGLAFGKHGLLYDSMNGPASDDEVNLIEKGGNYGWPDVNGYCNRPDEKKFCATHHVIAPLIAWTPTIAPAGLAYYGSDRIPEWRNALLLTTLKDASLHVLPLNPAGTAIEADHVFLKRKYGRLRDVTVSPRGDIYLSTSNRDWNPPRGFPKPNDDRIIRLSRIKSVGRLKGVPSIRAVQSSAKQFKKTLSRGASIYGDYCQSCHKADGQGVKGTIPPLSKSRIVNGNRKTLIPILLDGLSKPIQIHGVQYHGHMPTFHFLSDQQIAQVLTYIRSNFGNHSSNVSKVLVNRVRASHSKESDNH